MPHCAATAQGIEAKILFYRKAVKKIGANSPVFLREQKNAPKFRIEVKL
jgi:hypothetical protein